MQMEIRPFRETDEDALVEILKLNHQFDFPDVEGPEAMRRVASCEASVFLVAAINGAPCSLIRATYDASRAMIHLLSVHPDRQKSRVGTALVETAWARLRARGASSATVTDRSFGFWQRIGFERLPVFVVLRTSDGQALASSAG